MDKIRDIKFNRRQLKLIRRDDSDQSVIDEIFVDRMYRCLEPIIPSLVNPILDIGAHIGLFSIYARLLNPAVPIIALEPELDNFMLMKKNLKLNCVTNIITKQTALIDDGAPTVKLYLSKNTHNHSTMPLSADFVQVPAINLDKLAEEYKLKIIGLLKIDIEGAEFGIIKTLKHLNTKTFENMVIEYHEAGNNKRGDLENIIRQHGFSVEHFPNKFDKRFGLLLCRNKNFST
ncbi:MAG: FkbM family methyltransferase [Candidatus Magasanikbacteria bacterium]|nr:FkbM family methyltransferase [Candidatus Magasanikbacteria bacterium]